MIFSVKENTITAYGTIWDGNGMQFLSVLSQLESTYSEITVKLHTYGGSVFDGNIMANALRDSKAKIRLEIVGIAASMGFVISLYLEDVYMAANGFIMAHAPSGYTEGTAADHENNAKLLRAIEANFIKILTKKTGKTEAYVKRWLVGDNWMDAAEAKKEGLIKEIIEPENESEILNPQELGLTETYNRFTAMLTSKEEKTTLDHNMKKPIIEALALTGVNEQSSDTAVIAAVQAKFEAEKSELQGKLDAEIQKRTNVEAELAKVATSAITADLDQAKKEGKITDATRATYEAIGKTSGIETLRTVLAAIPARQTITSQIAAGGSTLGGRDAWTFDQWQKEDPKGLEALSKENPEAFKKLVNEKYKK